MAVGTFARGTTVRSCSVLVFSRNNHRNKHHPLDSLVQAFQRPHSANRHDAGCRGARADCLVNTMNRPRLIRGIKITWTVFCGMACVLLIALWVRSYWYWDWYNSGTVARANITIGSTEGGLGIIIRIGTLPDAPRPYSLTATPVGELPAADDRWELHASDYLWGGGEISVTTPHWFLSLISGILATLPWF